MRKLDITPALQQMERFIGFTIPQGGRFFVCDHDEVIQVIINGTISAEFCDEHSYKFVENKTSFVGLVFDGLTENAPIHRVGSTSISYELDLAQDFVHVRYETSGDSGVLKFRTFSGDWFVASLSDDGRYLVMAEPYEVALYELN